MCKGCKCIRETYLVKQPSHKRCPHLDRVSIAIASHTVVDARVGQLAEQQPLCLCHSCHSDLAQQSMQDLAISQATLIALSAAKSNAVLARAMLIALSASIRSTHGTQYLQERCSSHEHQSSQMCSYNPTHVCISSAAHMLTKTAVTATQESNMSTAHLNAAHCSYALLHNKHSKQLCG